MLVCVRFGFYFWLIFVGVFCIGSDNFCLKYLCNMVIIINVYFVGLFIVVYVNNDWMFMGIVLRLYVFILKKKCFISIFIFVFYGFFVIKILRGKIKIEIIFKV